MEQSAGLSPSAFSRSVRAGNSWEDFEGCCCWVWSFDTVQASIKAKPGIMTARLFFTGSCGTGQLALPSAAVHFPAESLVLMWMHMLKKTEAIT